MAIRKSILGIVSGITLGLAAFAAQPAAAAEVGECSMMLAQAQDARSSLDAIDAAMEQGSTDRAEWVQRIAEIDSELAARISEKNEATDALHRERAELVEEIRVLDLLHPKLSTQAEALRETVEQTERAYIACIEATI
jgi:chromosome segregation ATPase